MYHHIPYIYFFWGRTEGLETMLPLVATPGDERGRWHAAHVIKLNQDRTVEVEVLGQQGSLLGCKCQ